MNKLQQASSKQVREHYETQGYEVRISGDGHVRYRLAESTHEWLEGRWIKEYRIDERGNVHLI